jgi:hypothetical protein
LREGRKNANIHASSGIICGGYPNSIVEEFQMKTFAEREAERIAAQSQKTQEDAAIRERVQQHALEISKNLNDYLAEKSNTVEALVHPGGQVKLSIGGRSLTVTPREALNGWEYEVVSRGGAWPDDLMKNNINKSVDQDQMMDAVLDWLHQVSLLCQGLSPIEAG